jgi:hypothetical protein
MDPNDIDPSLHGAHSDDSVSSDFPTISAIIAESNPHRSRDVAQGDGTQPLPSPQPSYQLRSSSQAASAATSQHGPAQTTQQSAGSHFYGSGPPPLQPFYLSHERSRAPPNSQPPLTQHTQGQQWGGPPPPPGQMNQGYSDYRYPFPPIHPTPFQHSPPYQLFTSPYPGPGPAPAGQAAVTSQEATHIGPSAPRATTSRGASSRDCYGTRAWEPPGCTEIKIRWIKDIN